MFSINEIHLFWNGFWGNLTESFQLFQNLTPLEKGTSFLELVMVYCKGKVFRFFPEAGNCFLQEKRAGFSYVYISDHVYRSVFMRDDQDKLVESYQRGMVTLKDLAERDLYDMLRMITEDVAELQAGTTSTETIQMEKAGPSKNMSFTEIEM